MINDNILDMHSASAIIRVSRAIATVNQDISLLSLVRLLGTRSHRVGSYPGSSCPKIDSRPARPHIPAAK